MRKLTLLAIAALCFSFVLPAEADEYKDYPDLPTGGLSASLEGGYTLVVKRTDRISDARVTLVYQDGNFNDILNLMMQQAGVNFILDSYWNQPPFGSVRDRVPGSQPVTLSLVDVPFDTALDLLMKTQSVDYALAWQRDGGTHWQRTSAGLDYEDQPTVFISNRERLNHELGLGKIHALITDYIDPAEVEGILLNFDMLTSNNFGYWMYQGGGGGNGAARRDTEGVGTGGAR